MQTLTALIMDHAGVSDPPAISPPEVDDPRTRRLDYVHDLTHWLVGQEEDTPHMLSSFFELLFLFGESGDLDQAFDRQVRLSPAEAIAGWRRFSARVRYWAARADDYVERLSVMGQLSTRLRSDNSDPHLAVDIGHHGL